MILFDTGAIFAAASLIALAERLGITEIATTDRHHFLVVRPRHVAALTLLPEQL